MILNYKPLLTIVVIIYSCVQVQALNKSNTKGYR